MYVLDIECQAANKDLLVAELWERGTEGITELDGSEDSAHLRAFFAKEFDSSGLPAISSNWRVEEERNWIEVAESQWQSVVVGTRFFLAPGGARKRRQPGAFAWRCIQGWPAAADGTPRRNSFWKRWSGACGRATECSIWEPARDCFR